VRRDRTVSDERAVVIEKEADRLNRFVPTRWTCRG
jgi:hypothetical protein